MLPMRNLRLAILADNRPGFVKAMAEGLQRTVAAAGAASDLFPEGLNELRQVSGGQRDGIPGLSTT